VTRSDQRKNSLSPFPALSRRANYLTADVSMFREFSKRGRSRVNPDATRCVNFWRRIYRRTQEITELESCFVGSFFFAPSAPPREFSETPRIAPSCAVLYRPSMKSLSFTEFRRRASEILTLVEKGEAVRVVRHGKTLAKIVPAEAEEKIPAWKRPGLRLVRPGAALGKAILEERRKSR
jgi:prevent-host-death family protein